MELAPLTAGVDAGGQIGEERFVEGAPRELRGQHVRIDAGEHRAHAGGQHGARQRIGRAAPQRERRRERGAGEVALAVLAHILEEEVAEHDLLDARAARRFHRVAHARFVDGVRAGRRDVDDVQRQAEPVCLRLQERAPHRVHRDPVGVGVHGHEQRLHVEAELVACGRERERAVLAAAPTHPRLRTCHAGHSAARPAARRQCWCTGQE